MKKVKSPFTYTSTTMDPFIISPPKFWAVNYTDKLGESKEIIMRCPGNWTSVDVEISMNSIADDHVAKINLTTITSNEDYNYDLA